MEKSIIESVQMKRKYWIAAIVGLIMSIVSFSLMILIHQSPTHYDFLLQAVGITGTFMTALAFFTGASASDVTSEHEKNRTILEGHTKLLEDHTRLLENNAKLLEEIRDRLTLNYSRLKP